LLRQASCGQNGPQPNGNNCFRSHFLATSLFLLSGRE
jgi:hypothetical protein